MEDENNPKYITVEDQHGVLHFIAFGNHLDHSQMADVFADFVIMSAGWFYAKTGRCFGFSESLDVGAKPETDTPLARKTLCID